jgi:hypothetical protein
LRGHEAPGFGAGALALAWFGRPMTVHKGWLRLRPQCDHESCGVWPSCRVAPPRPWLGGATRVDTLPAGASQAGKSCPASRARPLGGGCGSSPRWVRGSSRSPASIAQRRCRSQGTNGPQARLCPGSPRRTRDDLELPTIAARAAQHFDVKHPLGQLTPCPGGGPVSHPLPTTSPGRDAPLAAVADGNRTSQGAVKGRSSR